MSLASLFSVFYQDKAQGFRDLGFRVCLDPGCPTFLGICPINMEDRTQNRKDIQGPGRA